MREERERVFLFFFRPFFCFRCPYFFPFSIFSSSFLFVYVRNTEKERIRVGGNEKCRGGEEVFFFYKKNSFLKKGSSAQKDKKIKNHPPRLVR